jgi:hypothetical protein
MPFDRVKEQLELTVRARPQSAKRGTMRYLLLLVPCVVALATPLYNTIEPRLFGFPFFFWFQLLLVPLSALFILAAYLAERRQ